MLQRLADRTYLSYHYCHKLRIRSKNSLKVGQKVHKKVRQILGHEISKKKGSDLDKHLFN